MKEDGTVAIQASSKRSILYFCLYLLSFLFGGCFLSSYIGSGYSAKIIVDNKTTFKSYDIKKLEDLVVNEGFIDRKEIESSENRKVIYYIKMLERGSQHSSELGMQLSITYSKLKTNNNLNDIILIDSVKIFNHHVGNTQPLRDEIDRIAELIYEEIKKHGGKGMLKIVRDRTFPGI